MLAKNRRWVVVADLLLLMAQALGLMLFLFLVGVWFYLLATPSLPVTVPVPKSIYRN